MCRLDPSSNIRGCPYHRREALVESGDSAPCVCMEYWATQNCVLLPLQAAHKMQHQFPEEHKALQQLCHVAHEASL